MSAVDCEDQLTTNTQIMKSAELPDTERSLVIYHGNCQDGFTAAWAVWLVHKDWEFYPATHGESPPDVTNRRVYLLDFSYKRPVMEKLILEASAVVILDHHLTAEADLMPLLNSSDPRIAGVFDVNKSGASLAWEWFHTEDAPQIIKYVEDRDLWRFQFPDTKPISAMLFSIPYDFERWTDFNRMLEYDFSSYEIVLGGQAILNKQEKDIAELCEKRFRYNIGGYNVWVVNLPYTFSSDAGHLLSAGEPFAATFYFDGKAFVFSLRSQPDGIDVSEIAKRYGGGGHKHAAGFKIDVPILTSIYPSLDIFAPPVQTK